MDLAFHKKGGGYTADPVTGLRNYSDGSSTKYFSVPKEQLGEQAAISYGPGKVFVSQGIKEIHFAKINAKNWNLGKWEMWIEAEDDLGNKGMASYAGQKFDFPQGSFFLRDIEIK